MVEKTLKSIEAFTSTQIKNSKFCIVCAKPATKLVHYQIEDAILVEKYCDECAKNAESKSIQTKGWYV
jgi:hypothetical protein